jgi:hypothetical protein
VRRLNGGSGASSDPDDVARPIDPKSPSATSSNAADPTHPELPAGAREIEELLAGLSQLRLAMSAELSAAAGALDDQRPDIAADLVAGARGDLEKLRASVARRTARELAPTLVAADPHSGGPAEPPLAAAASASVPRPRRSIAVPRWQGRILAGALAVGLSVLLLSPGGNSQSPQPNAAKAQEQSQAIDVRLVSSEFTTLRQTLESTTSVPAIVLEAGQSWHTAVERTLPTASKHAATATQIVALLREERALLASPAMRAPSMRGAAVELKASADNLFARLRALASTQVLAVLPDAITALPVAVTPATPDASASPDATTVPDPQETPTTPPASEAPSVTPTNPVPSLEAPSTPAPTTAPTLPSLPIPLPSLPALPDLIQHLTGLTSSPNDTTGAAKADPSPAAATPAGAS